MTAIFPAVLIETGTFTEHDGIWISYVGEDGDMVALGHDNPERVVAILNDNPLITWTVDDIDATWAVLTDRPAHNCVADDTTSCSGCEDAYGAPWWIRWGVEQDTPGAFPVTVVEA